MTSTAGRLAPGPHLLGLMEDQLDRLRGAGFADRDAALITYVLGVYVQGFVLQEQAPLAADQADGVPRTAVAETAADRFRSLPQDTPPFCRARRPPHPPHHGRAVPFRRRAPVGRDVGTACGSASWTARRRRRGPPDLHFCRTRPVKQVADRVVERPTGGRRCRGGRWT
ncbi:TetR/AcrR family transcriptional regulator C-terminal domain-containing protein [Streptomyces pimonensis]|uniref:TetR/AcrR family transcriptional regulator C-terminal domain-containing protein n=1 Tax=Streptomyces pimonensis TaxID=2860288 RepID=A0ABV4IXX2_9ACTN